MRGLRRIGPLCLISLVIAATPAALATDFSSTNFVVKDPVINELGGYSTSTSFRLWGNIPFIEPRHSTSTSFGNLPEFLNFASTTPTTTSAVSVTPTGGGSTIEILPRPIKGKPPAKVLRQLDCNNDGRVNLVDLSCLLYYADKTGPLIVPYDYNHDGVVDLVDVSILLYYWYDPA